MDWKAELARALRVENETERRLEVVALVAEAVRDLGLRPVVVGGLAVQVVALLAVPELDRSRLEERAAQEGLTAALREADRLAERGSGGRGSRRGSSTSSRGRCENRGREALRRLAPRGSRRPRSARADRGRLPAAVRSGAGVERRHRGAAP